MRSDSSNGAVRRRKTAAATARKGAATAALPRASRIVRAQSFDSPGALLDEIPEDFDPHVQGIDYGGLEDLVGYNLRRAQILIYADFYQALADWGISPQRYSALTFIARNAGLTLTRLARLLGVAVSGAVMIIRALESLGYVDLTTSPTDARAYSLRLTPAGRKALKRIDVIVRRSDERVAKSLTAAERATLIRLLARLHA